MFIFFKGVFIGVALVVPGLSGSLFACSLGLYENILYYAANPFKDIGKTLRFLVPVALGAGLGIMASARLVLGLCLLYPYESYSFFAGLTLGGLPALYAKMKGHRVKPVHGLLSALCLLVTVYVGRMEASGGSGGSGLVSLFVSGIAACGLMTFPGVSGSVILMLLHQYEAVYGAVSALLDCLGHMGNASLPWPEIILTAVFATGGAIGIWGGSRLMNLVFGKYSLAAAYAASGIITGSCVSLFESKIISRFAFALGQTPFNAFLTTGIMILFILIGYFASSILDTKENENNEHPMAGRGNRNRVPGN